MILLLMLWPGSKLRMQGPSVAKIGFPCQSPIKSALLEDFLDHWRNSKNDAWKAQGRQNGFPSSNPIKSALLNPIKSALLEGFLDHRRNPKISRNGVQRYHWKPKMQYFSIPVKMVPKVAEREPKGTTGGQKGAKWSPKGAKNVPNGAQRVAKIS